MEKPTEKQQTAILNMAKALQWNVEMPETKQAASNLISDMKVEIAVRLAATGQIRPSASFDFYDNDDNYENYDLYNP